jgi:ribosome biogenesis GTPase
MQHVPALQTLGWDEAWEAAFAAYREAGLRPGRISVPHRGGAYDVLTETDEVRARIIGRLRHERAPSELPVVGDWVALDEAPASPEIRAVLPRRTKLSRRAAHDRSEDVPEEQVVAANVDVVFITVSLADDPKPRLLERYLTLAWESGARPVIVLTKADLAPDPGPAVTAVRTVAGDAPVIDVSARTEVGLDLLRNVLEPGLTGSLIGPSGVGKSTLVNALLGDELLATGSVAGDGTGRHTTTRRQLVVLPNGGIVVDNPGIRELYLWVAEDGLGEAFPDIVELAASCRFADCRHETEPECAVRAALADGTLAEDRWASYRELEREIAELEERLARRERSRARRRRPDTGGS